MVIKNRILIADDEHTFLYSTADLLREQGYDCVTVTDADAAAQELEISDYNLLISDINMSGNKNLEFIKAHSRADRFIPIILVTGYPSIETATDSIQLPVIAYLVKPVEFDDLLHWIAVGIKANYSMTSMQNIRLRIKEWDHEVAEIQKSLCSMPASGSAATVDMFITNSFNNLAATLLDMKQLLTAAVSDKKINSACHLLNCPSYVQLQNALRDAVNTLELTKKSFKSRELGELRKRIESYLDIN